MNKEYKQAFEMLQKLEEKFNQRESEFKSAYEAYNNGTNYVGQYGKFRLNFTETLDLLNQSESALGSREYKEALKLAQDAVSKAQSIVGQSLPVISVEMDISNFIAGRNMKFEFVISNKGKVEATNINVTFGGSIELQKEIAPIEQLAPGESKKVSCLGLFKNPGDNQIIMSVEFFNEISNETMTTHEERWLSVQDPSGRLQEGGASMAGSLQVDRCLTESTPFSEYKVVIENKTPKMVPKANIALSYDETSIVMRDTQSRRPVKGKEFKIEEMEPGDKRELSMLVDVVRPGIHKISGLLNYEIVVTRKGKEVKEPQVVQILALDIDARPMITDVSSYNEMLKKSTNSLIGMRQKFLDADQLAEFEESVGLPPGLLTEDAIKYFNEAIEAGELEKRNIRDDQGSLDTWYFGMDMGNLVALHFELDKQSRVLEFNYFSNSQDSLDKLRNQVKNEYTRVLEKKGGQTIVFADKIIQGADAADAYGRHDAAAKIAVETTRISSEEKIRMEEEENRLLLETKRMQNERNMSADQLEMARMNAMTQTVKAPAAPAASAPSAPEGGEKLPAQQAVDRYAEMLKDCYEDGVMLPVERNVLEKFRKRYNISKMVADELEEQAKQERGVN